MSNDTHSSGYGLIAPEMAWTPWQQTWHDVPDILTTAQAAQLANVHTHTVRRWIYRNQLPAYKTDDGHWRITKNHLLAFLKLRAYPPLLQVENKQLQTALGDILPLAILAQATLKHELTEPLAGNLATAIQSAQAVLAQSISAPVPQQRT